MCLLASALAAVLAVTTLSVPAEAATKRKKSRPAPLALTLEDRADPSVAAHPGGFVLLSTGRRVPRAVSRKGVRFSDAGKALLRRPAWAVPGDMWASDVAAYGGRWLLFFSASVTGAKESSHCIGVAQAPSPTASFVPLDERPLICPPGLATAPAEDQFTEIAGPALAHGAIDPSFTVVNGRPYLLYKTDGKPSSIRVLPLTADGLHAAGRSRELIRSPGVIENPVLIRHGKFWYLFTSVGDYTGCDYRTAWRRSRHPFASWQHRRAHLFLGSARQRLCGPGGADIVKVGKRRLLYFHAWTCRGSRGACRAPLHGYRAADASRAPVRTLYGLRLGFTKKGHPKVVRWLRPPGVRG